MIVKLWIIYNHQSFLVFTVFQYLYEQHGGLLGDASFVDVSLCEVIIIL